MPQTTDQTAARAATQRSAAYKTATAHGIRLAEIAAAAMAFDFTQTALTLREEGKIAELEADKGVFELLEAGLPKGSWAWELHWENGPQTYVCAVTFSHNDGSDETITGEGTSAEAAVLDLLAKIEEVLPSGKETT